MKKFFILALLFWYHSYAQSENVIDKNKEIILNTFKEVLIKENSKISFSQNNCYNSLCNVNIIENNKIIKNLSINSKINKLNDKIKYQINIFNYKNTENKDYTVVCSKNNDCKFFNGKKSQEIDEAYEIDILNGKTTFPYFNLFDYATFFKF
ncbi:hypothetical protein [Silvanigrella aquatica]|uniref:Uncharacterized protein n=1 Tax=Silvanigrella aquatica TaxID=1915309 RepID=A0A1L4CZF1_9BACT|nr:hypothetical protein [Silvanigrella aquatica]APJ03317.1 hypothetical protein AXG55_05125 [Silvanigrella aquatica]